MATAHIIHAFLGFTSTRRGSEVSCPRTLPQKNPEDLVRLEPRTPGLRVKHLTTEPRGNSEYVFTIQRAIHTKGRQFKRCFIQRSAPFSTKTLLAFCNISVITVDIDLKLRVCVHFPKSNPYYKGRQLKMYFFRIMPLF